MAAVQLVIMGVSGSGKSVVGAALAERLGLPFADGDDLHPAANIAKMAEGIPLEDEDRAPWLAIVGDWVARHPDGCVIACSALKRSYRAAILSRAPGATFLLLTGDPELIARRQASRASHFMPAVLMKSQFAVLEPLADDEPGFTVDVDQTVSDVVEDALATLARSRGESTLP